MLEPLFRQHFHIDSNSFNWSLRRNVQNGAPKVHDRIKEESLRTKLVDQEFFESLHIVEHVFNLLTADNLAFNHIWHSLDWGGNFLIELLWLVCNLVDILDKHFWFLFDWFFGCFNMFIYFHYSVDFSDELIKCLYNFMDRLLERFPGHHRFNCLTPDINSKFLIETLFICYS